MELRYIATVWGMEEIPLQDKLRQIADAGYDGVEMGVPSSDEELRRLERLLADLHLQLVVQVLTAGADAGEHATSFEEQYRRAVRLKPALVNAHTGKDFFTPGENLLIIQRAAALEEEHGVIVTHETHRGRATFSTLSTSALLKAAPFMRLTADFSHWCCVHESMLENQPGLLQAAIERAWHVHARVGHPEGPQVTDPRAPEWEPIVETHLRWWQAIVDQHKQRGSAQLTFAPEFGPPGYMMTQPYTRQPVVDQWEVNLYMLGLLKQRLQA